MNKTRFFAALGAFTLFFCFVPFFFDQSDFFQNAINSTRDLFFQIRRNSISASSRTSDLILVTIDEDSCQKLGLRWPWPRRTIANLVREIDRDGAKVIALNFFFPGLENGEEASTRDLGEAMATHGSVVVGSTIDNGNRLVRPHVLISDAARCGYLEKIVDRDLVIRRSNLLRSYASSYGTGGHYEYSFPLQIVAADRKLPESNAFTLEDDGLLMAGGRSTGFYLDSDGSYLINYTLTQKDVSEVPAWKVLERKLETSKLKGKIVFVGLTSSLFSDVHSTALGLMPGVLIHANEYLSIVEGRPLRYIPDKLTFFVSWFVAICVFGLFLTRRFWVGFAALFVALFGLFVGAQILLLKDYLMEPFILLFGCLLGGMAGLAENALALILENRGLVTKTTRDKMTNLYTYDFLRMRLQQEWSRCQKMKIPVSVVMTDLDRFKSINDTLGHETGNLMIKRAGAVIKESVRGYDVVSRYGGDEFVIMLWHSNLEEAKAYRGRLRTQYETMAKKLDNPLLQQSSISIGVATFDPLVNAEKPASPQELIEEADKDLFQDKESRRKPWEGRR